MPISSWAPDQMVPAFYKRFINDVFCIWLHGQEMLKRFLEHANNCLPDIMFTASYGPSVSFLDTRVMKVNSTTITDLYTNNTDTHQYLLPSSHHPPHVQRNLPYGLALRIRMIVSDDRTFATRLIELQRFLAKRGYSKILVAQQFAKAYFVSRQETLERKRLPADSEDRTPLVVAWNASLPDLNDLVRSAFAILQSSPRLQSIFGLPSVSFKRSRNLRDLLVHTKPVTQRRSVSQEDAQTGTHSPQTLRAVKPVLSLFIQHR